MIDTSDPGRSCPLGYRYRPEDLGRIEAWHADTVYVIGGLYGNPWALDAIETLAASEPEPVELLFNGDFNWFNATGASFRAVNQRVLAYRALKGNVEAEIAAPSPDAGCGCAYPSSVPQRTVALSNKIMDRLQTLGHEAPELKARLAALPRRAVSTVADVRIGIVHGDAESLAGWHFSRENLSDPGQRPRLMDWFQRARVSVFASSHTCEPVLWADSDGASRRLIVNNGAADMPNFQGTRYGVITRLSCRPCDSQARLYGTRTGALHVDALAVKYDHTAWYAWFLSTWPPGTAAHESYADRILNGTALEMADAIP